MNVKKALVITAALFFTSNLMSCAHIFNSQSKAKLYGCSDIENSKDPNIKKVMDRIRSKPEGAFIIRKAMRNNTDICAKDWIPDGVTFYNRRNNTIVYSGNIDEKTITTLTGSLYKSLFAAGKDQGYKEIIRSLLSDDYDESVAPYLHNIKKYRKITDEFLKNICDEYPCKALSPRDVVVYRNSCERVTKALFYVEETLNHSNPPIGLEDHDQYLYDEMLKTYKQCPKDMLHEDKLNKTADHGFKESLDSLDPSMINMRTIDTYSAESDTKGYLAKSGGHMAEAIIRFLTTDSKGYVLIDNYERYKAFPKITKSAPSIKN
ncbi:MAG: hypothetical protein GY793_02775 [Proteobacteria bacterium]|nr:hypothetical protein [Pseudomonadota bacterium]